MNDNQFIDCTIVLGKLLKIMPLSSMPSDAAGALKDNILKRLPDIKDINLKSESCIKSAQAFSELLLELTIIDESNQLINNIDKASFSDLVSHLDGNESTYLGSLKLRLVFFNQLEEKTKDLVCEKIFSFLDKESDHNIELLEFLIRINKGKQTSRFCSDNYSKLINFKLAHKYFSDDRQLFDLYAKCLSSIALVSSLAFDYIMEFSFEHLDQEYKEQDFVIGSSLLIELVKDGLESCIYALHKNLDVVVSFLESSEETIVIGALGIIEALAYDDLRKFADIPPSQIIEVALKFLKSENEELKSASSLCIAAFVANFHLTEAVLFETIDEYLPVLNQLFLFGTDLEGLETKCDANSTILNCLPNLVAIFPDLDKSSIPTLLLEFLHKVIDTKNNNLIESCCRDISRILTEISITISDHYIELISLIFIEVPLITSEISFAASDLIFKLVIENSVESIFVSNLLDAMMSKVEVNSLESKIAIAMLFVVSEGVAAETHEKASKLILFLLKFNWMIEDCLSYFFEVIMLFMIRKNLVIDNYNLIIEFMNEMTNLFEICQWKEEFPILGLLKCVFVTFKKNKEIELGKDRELFELADRICGVMCRMDVIDDVYS